MTHTFEVHFDGADVRITFIVKIGPSTTRHSFRLSLAEVVQLVSKVSDGVVRGLAAKASADIAPPDPVVPVYNATRRFIVPYPEAMTVEQLIDCVRPFFVKEFGQGWAECWRVGDDLRITWNYTTDDPKKAMPKAGVA